MKNKEKLDSANQEKLNNGKQKVSESDYDLKATAAGKDQALKHTVNDVNNQKPHSGTRGK